MQFPIFYEGTGFKLQDLARGTCGCKILGCETPKTTPKATFCKIHMTFRKKFYEKTIKTKVMVFGVKIYIGSVSGNISKQTAMKSQNIGI